MLIIMIITAQRIKRRDRRRIYTRSPRTLRDVRNKLSTLGIRYSYVTHTLGIR